MKLAEWKIELEILEFTKRLRLKDLIVFEEILKRHVINSNSFGIQKIFLM